MRFPHPVALFTRPSRLIIVIPLLLLVHLLLSSTSSTYTSISQRYTPAGIDARVGWAYDESSDYDSNGGSRLGSGLRSKAGAALEKLGRLAGNGLDGNGGKGSGFSRQKNNNAGQRQGASYSAGGGVSLFERTGGSLYDLVSLSPSFLYDTRTSLDKLRLASTRFVAPTPPSPFAVFSQSEERQHIIVTGGFSSLGRSLVRDLLLLGEESGASDDNGHGAESDSRGGNPWNLNGWFGNSRSGSDDDEYDADTPSWWRTGRDNDGGDRSGFDKLAAAAKRKGIVVTLIDTTDRSVELDDMLKHAPLYHRSRVGFALPSTAASASSDSAYAADWDTGGGGAGAAAEQGADATPPPLEFIDPRSAAFSSSEVSLASFVAKGRLRIVKADARNATLLTALLNPHLSSSSTSGKPEKSRFGFSKRPVHSTDADLHGQLPPVSGIYHLAGYGTKQCARLNARDCADLERGGVKAIAQAVKATREDLRPWVVLGDSGKLERSSVSQWLKEDGPRGTQSDKKAAEKLGGHAAAVRAGDKAPILSQTTELPDSPSSAQAVRLSRRSVPVNHSSPSAWTHNRSARAAGAPQSDRHSQPSKRGYPDVSLYAHPLSEIARASKLHAVSLRLPPDSHIFGDSFSSRRENPINSIVQSAMGHLPILVDEDRFPEMSVASHLDHTADDNSSEPGHNEGRDEDEGQSVWANTGVVYIDDLVETLIAAGEVLARSNKADYLRRLSLLSEIEVVPPSPALSPLAGSSGRKSTAQETVDWIIQLTKSSSPVGYTRSSPTASFSASDTPIVGKMLDRSLAMRVLGTTPSTPLPLGLKAYIRSLLGRQAAYLDTRIGKACAPPPDLRTLNDALSEIHECSVQILGLVSSEHVVLACNPAYLSDPVNESPLTLQEPVPLGADVPQLRLRARWGPVGRVEMGFFCPFGPGGAAERIYWIESTRELEGRWVTDSRRAQLAAEDPSLWVYESFEVNFVRRDTRSYTLSISQYPQASAEAPKRRMVFTIDHARKGRDGSMKDMLVLNWQLLAETAQDWQTMEWRVNPLTCPKEVRPINGFTFMREDPLYTSQILFPSADGASSVAESTYEIQRCRDFRHAHDYSQKLNLWNERTLVQRTCARSMSFEGSDWFLHDLPVCMTDCTAPIPCLVTDKCRCSRSMCGEEKRATPQASPSPQEEVVYTDELSFKYDKNGSNVVEVAALPSARSKMQSLRERVDALPWDVVIQPHARHIFSSPVSTLPKGHVVVLPAGIDTHLNTPACHDVKAANALADVSGAVPSVADHLLVEAFRSLNVEVEDADFSIIPYYQGCYHDYLKENTYKKLADTVAHAETQILLSEKLRASNLVLPFLHDWGSCTGWWPDVEEVLSRTPPPPMSRAISWQVNGDLNTRCIKAERDIIVPAATRHAAALVTTFGNLDHVLPSSKRTTLAFFSGNGRAFGAFARTRLAAKAEANANRERIVHHPSPKTEEDRKEYLRMLGHSQFCLLPRDVAGWSSEAFDAIYAGCIPVFVADRTAHPFGTILSYSSFSLSVHENELHSLESTLAAVTPVQMERMQLALLKIRDAFIYADDAAAEWKRRGPIFFTLLSMAEKLALEWPSLPTHNTCSA